MANNTAQGLGGAIYNSSDTYDTSTMTLVNCTLTGNTSGVSLTGIQGSGGAIVSDGSALLVGCTIANNFTLGSGGGIEMYGGQTATLYDTVIAGNTSTGQEAAGVGRTSLARWLAPTTSSATAPR